MIAERKQKQYLPGISGLRRNRENLEQLRRCDLVWNQEATRGQSARKYERKLSRAWIEMEMTAPGHMTIWNVKAAGGCERAASIRRICEKCSHLERYHRYDVLFENANQTKINISENFEIIMTIRMSWPMYDEPTTSSARARAACEATSSKASI